jgi:hypothetical protein
MQYESVAHLFFCAISLGRFDVNFWLTFQFYVITSLLYVLSNNLHMPVGLPSQLGISVKNFFSGLLPKTPLPPDV